jgi:acylphosphatase
VDVRRYRVAGRVQGVGFRWFVREQARALGLRGWVRNEPDGAVLLEVAGRWETLAQLEAQLRIGPPASRVDLVSREEPDAASAGTLPQPFAVER